MSELDYKMYLEQVSKVAEKTFWGFLGCQLESLTPQRAMVSLQAEAHHLNVIGIVHGGVLSSLLDNAMGVLVMSILPEMKIVTTNLNVHFVAPMQPGRLVVSAELVHQSRKMLTVYGEVTDGEGKLGTIGTGTFRILSGD